MSSYAFCSFMPPATWPMNSSEMLSVVRPAAGLLASDELAAGFASAGLLSAGFDSAGLLSAGFAGAAPLAGAGVLADPPQAATNSAPAVPAPSFSSVRRDH